MTRSAELASLELLINSPTWPDAAGRGRLRGWRVRAAWPGSRSSDAGEGRGLICGAFQVFGHSLQDAQGSEVVLFGQAGDERGADAADLLFDCRMPSLAGRGEPVAPGVVLPEPAPAGQLAGDLVQADRAGPPEGTCRLGEPGFI